LAYVTVKVSEQGSGGEPNAAATLRTLRIVRPLFSQACDHH
jgi:hypothetical protein